MASWDFANQVVMVTGGAGGLGKDLTARLLQAGATVYISDNDEAALEQLSRDYQNSRLQVSAVDVTVLSQIKDWVGRIVSEHNRIDVVINAAGICPLCSIEDMEESLWDDIVDVSLKGSFLVSQAVMQQMKQQGYGRIINISSIGAHTGGAIAPVAYSAAKGGIISLTKSFATNMSPFGVTVNAVAPGPFETNMITDFPESTMEKIVASTPTRRVGKTEDVVHAVLFLADKETSHITGATIDVNGGLYMR
jgi:NAD(P)-dependent dehydrogenase (short-subunit alcohol dehydrogenase family)